MGHFKTYYGGVGGDKKENSPSIDLLIQSAILNQHLFILKKENKNYQNSKQKG